MLFGSVRMAAQTGKCAEIVARYSDLGPSEMAQEAKALRQSYDPDSRCAGIHLQMKADPKNAMKTALAVIRSGGSKERQTALNCGMEYCGAGFPAAVVRQFGKLSAAAQTDVVRWYGDNHVAEGTDNIVKSISKGSGELVTASLEAASKIGGGQVLSAIASQLGTQYGEAAASALCSFNGDVSSEVMSALSSGDNTTQRNALRVAGARRVHEAYGSVKELTRSADKDVSAAAYEALAGVAASENYGELCSMLEQSDAGSAAMIQKAAMNAVASESGDRQYTLAMKAMQQSSRRGLYYPLLAQSGTSEAIKTLQGEGNAAAEEALLDVENEEMLPIMLAMAKAEEQGAGRDKVLSRYTSLVGKLRMTPEERYIRLCAADGMEPGAETRNGLIAAIGKTRTVQALSFMRKYYAEKDYRDTVAVCVKDIVGSVPDFNGGKNVLVMLEMAKALYAWKMIYDAGAEAVVDDLKDIISKTSETGYSLSTDKVDAGKNGFWNIKKDFGDLDWSFDWCTEGVLTVTLRSVPVFKLDNQRGVQLVGGGEWKPYKSLGEWNTVNIKVAGDRLSVSVNGHDLLDRVPMTDAATGQAVSAKGFIGLEVLGDQLIVRDRRLRVTQ